jgi:hypothetical protein
LRHELAQLVRQSSSCLFDVTAIRKAYLADLVALSLNGPITRLMTFNLQRKPEYDRPWDMLLHNLLPNDYSYVDLLDTSVFQERAADVLLRGRFLVTLLGLSTLLFLSGSILYFKSEALGVGVQALHIAGAVASVVSFAMGILSRGTRRH